jgi:hypothetical protein
VLLELFLIISNLGSYVADAARPHVAGNGRRSDPELVGILVVFDVFDAGAGVQAS